jgi:hypothetical protein
MLAKTGVEFPSHALRAAVVDGILAKAASGDADPRIERYGLRVEH